MVTPICTRSIKYQGHNNLVIVKFSNKVTHNYPMHSTSEENSSFSSILLMPLNFHLCSTSFYIVYY